MSNVANLTLNDILFCIVSGAVLACIYMYLMWQTIHIVQQIRKKKTFLFLSSILRIFLLLFVALALSQNNLAFFLTIICSFLLVRIILLKMITPSFKKQIKKSETIVLSKNQKNSKLPLKKRNKRR